MKNRMPKQPKKPVLTPGLEPVGRIQIGGRLSIPMNDRVKISAVLTDVPKDQILEDALAVYYGIDDADVRARRRRVLEKIEALKEGKVPFELPLTPNKNNATLTSRGGSAKLTIHLGRMGS